MFNRSAILRAAWKGYRAQVAMSGVDLPFSRKLFSSYLKSEWRYAKGRAYLEAKVAAEPAMTPRAAEIRNELLSMQLSDMPISERRHSALTLELFRISAGAQSAA